MNKERLTVFKIGGKIVDNEANLNAFLRQFSLLTGNKILVHGGGKTASEILQSLGIKQKMVSGRRVTDSETLKVVQMVYGGLINSDIVAKLQAEGCNAIGMNGADGNTILAAKRAVTEIDFGFVGDVKKVNPKTLTAILNDEIVPVFCALTHDGRGQILNTNADTIASVLAAALTINFAVDLVYCFELNGILENPEDENSVIREINQKSYTIFKKENIITDGMIPKIDSAFEALAKGVQNVIITNYKNMESTSGTRISLK